MWSSDILKTCHLSVSNACCSEVVRTSYLSSFLGFWRYLILYCEMLHFWIVSREQVWLHHSSAPVQVIYWQYAQVQYIICFPRRDRFGDSVPPTENRLISGRESQLVHTNSSFSHGTFPSILSVQQLGVFMNEKRWLRDKDNKRTFLGRWYNWFILRKGLFSCFSFEWEHTKACVRCKPNFKFIG